MKNSVNLQDAFLNAVRKEKIGLTVFLTNGYQMRGVVRGFDPFTVVLESDGKQNLIYKHAISTMTPQRTISIGWERTQHETGTSA